MLSFRLFFYSIVFVTLVLVGRRVIIELCAVRRIAVLK